MARFLMAVGVLLLFVGIIVFIISPEPEKHSLDFPVTIFGAVDRIAVDPDRLRAAIEDADQRANALNRSGIASQVWAKRLLFLVFLVGSTIAFLAGLQKMFEELKKNSSWFTVTIGLLGSISAIATSGASYLEGQAKDSFNCISSIETEVRQAVENIREERDANLAEQYLDEMQRKVARCPR